MIATVDSDISISGLTEETLTDIVSDLTLKNPEYLNTLKLGVGKRTSEGLSVWDKRSRTYVPIPETVTLYWEDAVNQCVHVPAGYLDRLIELVPDCTVVINRRSIPGQPIRSRIPLSEVQEMAVRACIRNLDNPFIPMGGVLVGPCGCGKTRMGLAIAAELGRPTLWLTNKISLAEQARNSAAPLIGEDGLAVTKDGKLRIGERITFATVQTMSCIDLTQLRDVFGLVIVDECHHCVGTVTQISMFSKVLNSLNCVKLGLTATPKRSDGLTAAMFSILGNKLYEVERSDIADRFCKIEYVQKTSFPELDLKKCKTRSGTISSAKLMSQLIADEGRLAVVIDSIEHAPKPCLVLSSRLAYLDDIHKVFEDSVLLKNERTSDAGIILATYQLVAEGYDRPDLASVVLATPEGNETRIIQSAGRVQRSYPGKDVGYVIDIVDLCDYTRFEKMAKLRKRIIQKLNIR